MKVKIKIIVRIVRILKNLIQMNQKVMMKIKIIVIHLNQKVMMMKINMIIIQLYQKMRMILLNLKMMMKLKKIVMNYLNLIIFLIYLNKLKNILLINDNFLKKINYKNLFI